MALTSPDIAAPNAGQPSSEGGPTGAREFIHKLPCTQSEKMDDGDWRGSASLQYCSAMTEPDAVAPRAWRQGRRIVTLVALLLAVAAVAYGVRGIAPIEASADAVRGFVAGLGWWGPPAFVGLFAFRSVLVLPSVVLLAAGGVCFGVLGGTLLGALGLTFSAALKWTIAQLAWRDACSPRCRRLRRAGHERRARQASRSSPSPRPIRRTGELLHTAAVLAGMRAAPLLLAVAGGVAGAGGCFSFFARRGRRPRC